MVPEVMRVVTGNKLVFTDGTLEGYGRYRLRGRVYPGIIKSAHESVQGRIYNGVNRYSLARLDKFEAEEYRRIRVCITGVDGRRVMAWAYVIRKRYIKFLTREAWDVEEFRNNHLKHYLQRIVARTQG